MKKTLIALVMLASSCHQNQTNIITKEFYGGVIKAKTEVPSYHITVSTKDSMIREVVVSKAMSESFNVGDTIK